MPGFSGRDGEVKPGQTWTYRLRAGRRSAGFWPSHDHSTSMRESLEGGLYGGLSIRGRRECLPDREFVVVFAPTGEFQTINGRAFVGNTPVFRGRPGETVQWDVMAIGSEHHTFHVHGHRWLENGISRDTKTVGPAESFRIRWREDAPGDVVLSLPRRAAHGPRHDRHLPGVAMSLRVRVACLLAALAAATPAVALAQHADGGSQDAGGVAQVAIRTTAVDPARTTVLVGERVQWLNVSLREHTVTSRDGLFDSDRLRPGGRFGYTFASAGSFAYYCRIHPFITGAIDATRVLLRAVGGRLVRGEQLVLEGRTQPGGGPVTIERDLGSGFTPVATVPRASDGSFSARLTVDASAGYRAVSGADASAPVRVEVVPARTLTVSTVRGRHRQLVRVTVSPALPDGTVQLQRHLKERFGWWTIRRAPLTRGTRATIGLARGSKARVRVVLTQPDGETSVAVSRVVRLAG